MSAPIEQHAQERAAQRAAWAAKPALREAYRSFYRLAAERLAASRAGGTVELGAGIGAIKEVLPECVTTDIFPGPGVDRVENAYRLGFADAALDNVILFDVFHHLQYPGSALAEIARVVRPGGRLILFEPAMGLLGRVIYGLFHREPVAWRRPIEWFGPRGFDPAGLGYHAAQGNCWRVFRTRREGPLPSEWRVREVLPLPALAYVGTGGFAGPQLYPAAAYRLMARLDRLFAPFPSVFATRMLVVLERDDPAPEAA